MTAERLDFDLAVTAAYPHLFRFYRALAAKEAARWDLAERLRESVPFEFSAGRTA